MLIRDEFTPTVETFEYMMQAHLAAKDFKRVIQYENDALAINLAPTRTAYRYLLAAYASASDSRGVDRTLRNMVSEKIEVDASDYFALLAHAPTSSLVKRWIQDLKTKLPDTNSQELTSAALTAFVRTKDDSAAMEIYSAMTHAQRVEAGAYDAVIRACLDASSTSLMWKSVMLDVRTNNVQLKEETYNSLVEYYGRNGEQNRVLGFSKEMQQLGYTLSESASKMVMQMQKGGKLLNTLLEEVEEQDREEGQDREVEEEGGGNGKGAKKGKERGRKK